MAHAPRQHRSRVVTPAQQQVYAQVPRRRLVTLPRVPHVAAQRERLVLPAVVVVADAAARRRRHRSKH